MTGTLHVESVGQGRPVVLLHGWALHAGLFTPLLPAFARAHRVLAADLPGHGHSTAPATWTLDAVVDALAHTFDAEGELDVLGWSLGGLVALAWARAQPGRVRRLVLVGTSPRFVAGDGWPHAMAPVTLQRFADELRVAYRPTLQRFLTLQVQGSDDGKATLAALRHALHARGTPDPSVLSDALEVLGGADLRDAIPGIGQRTLVVAGDRDTLAPLGASRWLAAALPRATLVEIPGAAHAPFLSHPDAFVAAVLPFLDAP